MSPAKKRRLAAAKAAAENQGATEMKMEAISPIVVVVAKQPMNAVNTTTHNILTTTKLLEQHRATLKTLQCNISELLQAANSNSDDDDDDGGGSNNAAHASERLLSTSLSLTTLKSLQRKITLAVESHALSSKTRREHVEECSLVLENLKYERNYLRGEINGLKGWKAESLERMAWSELGMMEGGDGLELKEGEEGGEEEKGGGGADEEEGSGEDVDMEGGMEFKATTAEEAIDAYLLGSNNTCTDSNSKSHRDPTNHTAILRKLQSDLQARSTLVQQLSQSKLQLKELQTKRNEYRQFLTQIPRKMNELEKVGESLNDLFGGANDVWKNVLNDTEDEGIMEGDEAEEKKVTAANLLVHRPSCDRTRRFQLAQSNLPSPLYVLFVQLTGYLDAWASLEKLEGSSGSAAPTAAAAGGEKRKSRALDGFVSAKGMQVTAVPPGKRSRDSTSWSVVLTLSPSDILPSEITSILGGKSYSSQSAPSAIKIVFSYSEEEGVVFASVKNEGNEEGLLDNLFPGDDGLANPNVSLSLLKQDEDEHSGDDSDEEDEGVKDVLTNDSTKDGGTHGKPYYWCQVLSGLNFPPPSSSSSTNMLYESDNGGKEDASFQIQTCTKAVVRQLIRRIRARKTLDAIVEYLGKRSQLHPLPIHPTMRGEDGSSNHPSLPLKAKLHSWTEDSSMKEVQHNSSVKSTTKRYIATIKRKSCTLKATVVIDTQNYPATPPIWSLQNEDGSSGTPSSWGGEHGSISSLHQNTTTSSTTTTTNAPPLFDATLHRIECHVNQELDKFVCQNVETTYDWILIHQLVDIVSCWDESAGEGGGGRAKSGDDTVGGYGRLRKGKDRRLMGFGERSPFFWYRNGM